MTNHYIRSRQKNPCDHLFWKSRGYSKRPYNWQEILEEWEEEKRVREHILHSNGNNPNNDLYWVKRGYPERPINWKVILYELNDYE